MKSPKAPAPAPPAPPVRNSGEDVQNARKVQAVSERKRRGIRSTLMNAQEPTDGGTLG